jgi:hypothetical protein
VALFIKNVRYEDFEPAIQSLIADDIRIGKPGSAWQSVNIDVPLVDPQLPLETQMERLDLVFDAARRLYLFFVAHEAALLSIPQYK